MSFCAPPVSEAGSASLRRESPVEEGVQQTQRGRCWAQSHPELPSPARWAGANLVIASTVISALWRKTLPDPPLIRQEALA